MSSQSEQSAALGSCSDQSIVDFREARAAASFDPRELTYLFDGGRRMTLCKEKVAKQLEADPVFDNKDFYELTRPEIRRRTVEIIRAVFRLFMRDEGDFDMRNARLEVTGLYNPNWITRNGVHFGLFLSAITSQGTQEQQDEWVPRATTLNLFGCFAMTELRGGTHVKGLETTATFIPGAGPDGDGEFEIHTPTIGATKWWIGGAGETATHAAVYARLITGGVDYGVHTFIVPLRDLETHLPLPGVYIGDVGAKMGRNGIDNGWIQFHHVRIPRSNFLCRLATVDPAGKYTRSSTAKPQLAYGALLMGRASMVLDSAIVLQMATTIITRWALARRQGAPFREETASEDVAKTAGIPASTPVRVAPSSFAGAGSSGASSGAAASSASSSSSSALVLQPQLLDYSTMQANIMPLIATAVAFTFSAHRMKEMFNNLMSGLESQDVSALPDVHATSAGMKAFCTWATYYGIDTCRQMCGGHGYSSYSRLPSMFEDFAVMCSWEGDNTVMALQTARYLLACYKKAKAGQAVVGSARYLTDHLPVRCGATTLNAFLNTNELLTAMRWRARISVQHCADMVNASVAKGRTDGEAWNDHAVALVDASRAHVYLNIASFFAVAVSRRMILEEEQLGVAYEDDDVIDPLTGVRVSETEFDRVTGTYGAGFTRMRDDPKPTTPTAGSSTASSTATARPHAHHRRSAATRAASAQASASTGPQKFSWTRVRRSSGSSSKSATASTVSATSSIPADTGAPDPIESPLYPMLKQLLDLFILHHIQSDLAYYLRYGYFTAQHATWVDGQVSTLCGALRQQALPLTDSFNISDFVINSPMARADGDVYRAYMTAVKRVPEARNVISPYYHELIKPLFEGEDFLLHQNYMDEQKKAAASASSGSSSSGAASTPSARGSK